MGLYDTVYSNYDLGPGFWNKELRTHNLNGYLSYFWIDPKGYIWMVDHGGTYDFDYSEKFSIIKNSNHGKVSPFFFSGELEFYPSRWKAYYAPTPSINVLFSDGKVVKVL